MPGPVDQAIALAGLGFGIIPTDPVSKAALILWGQVGPLRDAESIRAFWARAPHAKVAITPPAHCIIVDIDVKDGKNGYQSLQARGYEWPTGGWRWRTPGGGEHAVFTLPAGIAGCTDTGVLCPGVDRRGSESGYVVAHFLHGCDTLSFDTALPAPWWVIADLIGRTDAAHEATPALGISDADLRLLAERAATIADAFNGYDEWRELGMALHHETAGSDYGLALFDWLSQQPGAAAGGKYDALACAKKWASFSDEVRRGKPITIKKLLKQTNSRDIASRAGTAQRALKAFGTPRMIEAPPATAEIPTVDAMTLGAHFLASGKVPDTKNNWPATIDLVLLALRTEGWGVKFGFDRFKQSIMHCDWNGPNAGQWAEITDTTYTACREALIAVHFDPKIGTEVVRDAIRKVADERSFDSAQVWLERQQWDEQPRIERFFIEYCGAADTPYTRAVGRYFWSGAAGRIIEPGHQCDMIPILITRGQGLRKTRGIESMNPFPEASTTISLTDRDADLSRRLRGRLIVELGELKGMRTSTIEAIKTWITERYDTWIPKFVEFATNAPRRFMVIGSTNEVECLPNDPSGSRRFLPLMISRLDTDTIERDCCQLWAEGAELFMRAEGPKPARQVDWRDAERLALEVVAQHTEIDEFTETVAEAVAKVPHPFQMRDLFLPLGLAQAGGPGRMTETRIGNILRYLSYRSKQTWTGTPGRNVRVWSRS